MQVSASQISMFLGCQRQWYFKYIKKFKEPTTDALTYGSDFHTVIENTFLEKEGNPPKKIILNESIHDMVKIGWEKGILYIPKTYRVEQPIRFTIVEGVEMIGYIDLLDVSNGKIIDHKTVKGFNYAETEKTLIENLQLLIYAKWYLNKLENKQQVILRHNQFNKLMPRTSKFIEVIATRQIVDSHYNNVVFPAVKQMVECSKKELKDIPTNKKHCNKYNKECFVSNECKNCEVIYSFPI